MGIMRRVLAILAVVATLFLAAPAPATADSCDGLCRDRLVQVGLQGKVVQLVADGDSTCALTEAGDVYCWGADDGRSKPAHNPLLLITVGALLVAGGTTLLMLSRP
jgi:Regulator of Chromosome Condensation (RCC1) repeat protein